MTSAHSIIFTRHAIQRMSERQITKQDVADTLRYPRVSYVSQRSGNTYFHGPGYTVVMAKDNPNLVVTIITSEQPGRG